MAYRLRITEHANEMLENHVFYLRNKFKSNQASSHLIQAVENIFERLEDNPKQFPICKDSYLAIKGYRIALLGSMNYSIVFSIQQEEVIILGIFNQLENYETKMRREDI